MRALLQRTAAAVQTAGLRRVLHAGNILFNSTMVPITLRENPTYLWVTAASIAYSAAALAQFVPLPVEADIALLSTVLVAFVYVGTPAIAEICFIAACFAVLILGLLVRRPWPTLLLCLAMLGALVPRVVVAWGDAYSHQRVAVLLLGLSYAFMSFLAFRQRIREEVSGREERIRELNRHRRIISHDIKNYISSGRLALSLVENRLKTGIPAPEEVRRLVNAFGLALLRVELLARRLTYGATTEKGPPVPALDALADVHGKYLLLFERSRIRVDGDPGTPRLASITVPEHAWNCVLYNVYDNLVKYARSQVSFSATETADGVEFVVVNDTRTDNHSGDSSSTGFVSIADYTRNTNIEFEFGLEGETARSRVRVRESPPAA